MRTLACCLIILHKTVDRIFKPLIELLDGNKSSVIEKIKANVFHLRLLCELAFDVTTFGF